MLCYTLIHFNILYYNVCIHIIHTCLSTDRSRQAPRLSEPGQGVGRTNTGPDPHRLPQGSRPTHI